MHLDCGPCVVRPVRVEDAQVMATLANDFEVARFVRDQFPHPYSLDDAHFFIRSVAGSENVFSIEVDGAFAGGISYEPLTEERRFTAEIGYWLGQRYWGRGIATAAVAALTKYVFETTDLVRLTAGIYSSNPRSMRVLEKCGYQREGVFRKAVVKFGEFFDIVVYARLRT